MSIFTKKKTFADRFPAAKAVYSQLSPAQRRVLDEFSYLERKHLKADRRLALERIGGVYVVPKFGASLSTKEIEKRTQLLFDGCLAALQRAHLTTNISGRLFADATFQGSTDVKTIFTKKAKTWDYTQHRHAVEANALGFKIDWSVSIKDAAEARPIYAGLNFTGHPYGAAAAYGSVSLVLKHTVRDRCTFINTDTFDGSFHFKDGSADQIAAARKKICTAAQMETLLANISDNQLKALCQVADGAYVFGDFPPNYIEAHVYGGIVWARDLEEIRIAHDKFSDEAKSVPTGGAAIDLAALKGHVKTFATKYGVRAETYRKGAVVETISP